MLRSDDVMMSCHECECEYECECECELEFEFEFESENRYSSVSNNRIPFYSRLRSMTGCNELHPSVLFWSRVICWFMSRDENLRYLDKLVLKRSGLECTNPGSLWGLNYQISMRLSRCTMLSYAMYMHEWIKFSNYLIIFEIQKNVPFGCGFILYTS